MQTLKASFKFLFIFLFIVVNGYCLANLLTDGAYCRHFRLNASNSLNFYIFTTSPLPSIERGIYVSLSHPYSYQDLLKQIVGLPGDQILIRDQHVFINDTDYGYIHQVSPSGLVLSAISEGIIPEDFFFVHATHPQSFDSRYAEFGLVEKMQLKERLWPIF